MPATSRPNPTPPANPFLIQVLSTAKKPYNLLKSFALAVELDGELGCR